MQRRQIIQTAVGVASAAFFTPMVMAKPKPQVEVWKDAGCGCCKDWIKHLEAEGFQVKAHDGGNAEARTRLRMPEKMGSCHTALVGGYAIEGHVPAKEIHRLLKERPKAIGLAVPGMPIGSPGMDGSIYEARKDAYDVLLVLEDGKTRSYQSYPSKPSIKS
ncbi:MAG TPA: DUF411 domain-containing protein [Polaromonas sp.]|uniref:DUF411 domain-containing protein n=1 Tax=Polaromonas sp. TaxID=1869339 RepID=UPI002D24D29C|nr:DUF411 domain-containing protein [Polaromonas sp.]HYW56625.1 DUF411 domain-containing protein [Polaromonas sp.]